MWTSSRSQCKNWKVFLYYDITENADFYVRTQRTTILSASRAGELPERTSFVVMALAPHARLPPWLLPDPSQICVKRGSHFSPVCSLDADVLIGDNSTIAKFLATFEGYERFSASIPPCFYKVILTRRLVRSLNRVTLMLNTVS